LGQLRAPAARAGGRRPRLSPSARAGAHDQLRRLQYAVDDATGVGKRSRKQLAPEYAARYRREILAQVDLDELIEALPAAGIGALLCVERDPEACHRSLIAERLAADHGFSVLDLRP